MNRNPFTDQAWRWLGRELDCWAETGATAQFWWRDDDASDAGAALERLLQASQTSQAPLALAVIPAIFKPGLVAPVQAHSLVSVVQHGYAHNSHAAPGQRKIELGGERNANEIEHDLGLGKQILVKNFGKQFVPALVPPWNRIDPTVVAGLPKLGFSGISTMKRRTTPPTRSGTAAGKRAPGSDPLASPRRFYRPLSGNRGPAAAPDCQTPRLPRSRRAQRYPDPSSSAKRSRLAFRRRSAAVSVRAPRRRLCRRPQDLAITHSEFSKSGPDEVRHLLTRRQYMSPD